MSPQAADADPNGRDLFLANIGLIEGIVRAVSRRHLLRRDEAAEFSGWVMERIVFQDYAIFRKFQGRSSLATYLHAAVGYLYLDYRNEQWGRWRPSAWARRNGPIARKLEELVHRDGCPVAEAVRMVKHGGCTLSERELLQLANAIPPRPPRTAVSLGSLGEHEDPAAEMSADPPDQELGLRVRAALRAAVGQLAAADCLILRLHFLDGMSVADISRALALDQKALYRRIEAIEADLQKKIEAAGISRALVRELLEDGLPD